MNTRLLMTSSSIIMGLAGITLPFMPDEVMPYLSSSSGTAFEPLVLQILGALYFAFAMVNWTSKANLIGGIYARPISIGNLTHFVIGALALIKGYSSSHNPVLLVPTLVYAVFAISFAIVFFRHPIKEKS